MESDNLIVLDTNFLLDIIQNPTDIGKKYIESLCSVKDNIYIPYLVAVEFNFRKSGIKKEKHYNITKYRDSIKGNLKTLEESISDHESININTNTEEFSSELLDEAEKFEKRILGILDNKIATYITQEENTIYEKLISIVENNIGEKYSQEWIDDVESEGEDRYKNNIPPGFDDEVKDDTEESSRRYDNLCYQRKFGDLIIWKDILNYSKSSSRKGTKVIYVTNDGQSKKKSDLLYKVKDLTVGPHISLMNELQIEAQKELYIVPNLRFIQLVTELSDSQMEEIKHRSELQNRNKQLHLSIYKTYENEKNEMFSQINNHLTALRMGYKRRENLKRLLEQLELEIQEKTYLNMGDSENNYVDKNYSYRLSNIKNEIYELNKEIDRLNQINSMRENNGNRLLEVYNEKNKYDNHKSDDY